MQHEVAQRMQQFQPGIFNVLDERRRQRLAQGLPVYNLSIGTPDFLPEPHVVQALAQAASDPANYRYSLTELPQLVSSPLWSDLGARRADEYLWLSGGFDAYRMGAVRSG